MYYKPKHFQLFELVPKAMYGNVPSRKLWQCWDPRALWTADKLRETYGPFTVNDWYWGGSYQYRGWRPQNPPPGQKWAAWTQHAWWKALDGKFKNVSAEEVRADIKANKYPVVFQYITCIEENVSWLHFDCRNFDGLLLVTP